MGAEWAIQSYQMSSGRWNVNGVVIGTGSAGVTYRVGSPSGTLYLQSDGVTLGASPYAFPLTYAAGTGYWQRSFQVPNVFLGLTVYEDITHSDATLPQYNDDHFVTSQISATDFSPSTTSCQYCSTEDVRRFLYRNVQDFDANTVLSADDVKEVIKVASQRIEDYTQRTWCPKTYDEYLDVRFSAKWRWSGDYVLEATTTMRPIRSITALKVVQGGTEVDVTTMGPDRRNGWYMNDKRGDIFIVGTTTPSVTHMGLHVTYTYGETTLPDSVRGACYRLAAAEIMESENYAVQLPEESSTAGTVADKVKRWTEDAYRMLDYNRDIVFSAAGGG